jgi:hypothetical protein
MSKFIKLTNLLLNPKYIQSIRVKPNAYHIHVMSNKFEGLHFSLVGTGGGTISSHNSEIIVCETKNSIDYKILSDWIDKQ